jgi:lipid-A-disaccharide synthase
MAVIFPFEPKCYADTDLPVEFVGHPFLVGGRDSPVKYDPAGPILLLPGSRKQAVQRIFPVLLEGFRAFGEREAVVLFPSSEILEVLRSFKPPATVKFLPVVERRRRTGHPWPPQPSDAPSHDSRPVGASAVLTSSGTMSMHCVLAAIPGAIAYRANPITYLIGRVLVKVEQLGIANLLLGEPVYPEYLQGAATPEALAGELRACIHDPKRRQRVEEQANRLRALLSVPADRDAADWLARQLG